MNKNVNYFASHINASQFITNMGCLLHRIHKARRKEHFRFKEVGHFIQIPQKLINICVEKIFYIL